jgi:hypothetical protein
MKLLFGSLIISMSTFLCCQSTQNYSTGSYWTDIDAATDYIEELPTTYRALNLNLDDLKTRLNNLKEVVLPLPKGSYMLVELEESTTMSPELAAKYPEIKSYVVKNQSGIISGRIDINPSGFYAMIVTDSITFFINPTVKKGLQYVCYDKRSVKADVNNPFYDQYKDK